MQLKVSRFFSFTKSNAPTKSFTQKRKQIQPRIYEEKRGLLLTVLHLSDLSAFICVYPRLKIVFLTFC
jgi:hypothetical protein